MFSKTRTATAVVYPRPSGAGDGPAHTRSGPARKREGLTLVEMLVAVAITLLIMATVVSIFASVSSSVQNRRAVIEVGTQLRHVRNVLQRDLEGATCPLLPWQKPESNHGYFEIIEGLHCDFYPSMLTDTNDSGPNSNNPEIDHATSTVPSSNLALPSGWVTDGGGLGDYDDILAFTTRNEKEPFSGRAPALHRQVEPPAAANDFQPRPFGQWQSEVIKSPVAEVIWYCVENPVADTDNYFGEPGFRTIYRRVLLVAPWLNYSYNVDGNNAKSRPGVLRVIDLPNISVEQALAALITFQERYDISARIEFDPTIDAPDGRWTIVANTLADLTKRENRYEHHGFVLNSSRQFPFVMASAGGAAPSNVSFIVDEEYGNNNAGGAVAVPRTEGNAIVRYDVTDRGADNFVRPLAVLEGGGTARAIINEEGKVVHVTTGLVPLGVTSPSTSRRGEDLMMSQALGFDVQVFDPEAPVYALRPIGAALKSTDSDAFSSNIDVTAVGPDSAGWITAGQQLTQQEAVTAIELNGPDAGVVSFGAYVDLGYDQLHDQVLRRTPPGSNYLVQVSTPFAGLAHAKSLLQDARLTRVYDTWSFHYENDGLNQDESFDAGPLLIDEGTNGFDNPGWYDDNGNGVPDTGEYVTRLGVDDFGERETSPPYPSPLRAVQVKLRVYEPDSRQPREVTVRQHFVPE